MKKVYVFDIESYKNLFVVVFKQVGAGTPDQQIFVIHDIKDGRNDSEALSVFLSTAPSLIGYNCVGYDGQLLEAFIRGDCQRSAAGLYGISQRVIEKHEMIYREWDLSLQYLDLYKIWHFDNKNKNTSLKWLEFFFRMPKIKDLPFEHTTKITQNQLKAVIDYCIFDVDFTEFFYEKSKDKIQDRREIYVETKEKLIWNKSNSSIGTYLFGRELSKALNIPVKKLKEERTFRHSVKIKDVILPNIEFATDAFKGVLEGFKSATVYSSEDGDLLTKGAYASFVKYKGIKIDFGMGGGHAAVPKSVYRSSETHMMLDIDGSSYYPNLGIRNRVYPEHLTEKFCDVYQLKYEERQLYPKATHPSKNRNLKELLNCVYGNSKQKDSIFFDPKYTVFICVNGQLLLCKLIEDICEALPQVELIQMNTDGITLYLPRELEPQVKDICKKWEEFSNITLEYNEYMLMVMPDVNNYVAVFNNGKTKSKGRFQIYDEMVDNEEYHKNPSANIIAKAFYNYYVKDMSIESTIQKEDNIFEFLFGVKKQKGFEFVVWKDNRPNMIKDRVLRYYISNSGGQLYKHYYDGTKKINGVNVSNQITPLQEVKQTHPLYFPDLNKDYYIEEALKEIAMLKEIKR